MAKAGVVINSVADINLTSFVRWTFQEKLANSAASKPVPAGERICPPLSNHELRAVPFSQSLRVTLQIVWLGMGIYMFNQGVIETPKLGPGHLQPKGLLKTFEDTRVDQQLNEQVRRKRHSTHHNEKVRQNREILID